METRRGLGLLGILLTAMLGSLVLAGGCAGFGRTVHGSSAIETRDLDYSGFTEVEVGSAFHIDIIPDSSFLVKVTLNENLFDHLRVSRQGESLQIRLESGYNYVETTQRVTITMPDLRRLNLSGAARGNLKGYDLDHDLELDLSGASSLTFGDIRVGQVSFDISGASHVLGRIAAGRIRFGLSGASTAEVEGTAEEASVEASGASRAALADLSVVDATVELSGASYGRVNASGKLRADLSGASKLFYAGDPEVRVLSTSGSSTVNPW